ncbi:MAG: H-X9-DG-CTERM domain-containing protein, partial [Planctomycetota bacterium]|nr:H-X9-DG-CTERM domain-containing protein [Planctomycetota bacterium]
MQTKRKVNWFLFSVFCLSVSVPASGADTAARLYQALQPCIDDQTFAVVHVDLARLDVDVLTVYAVSLVKKHTSLDVGKRVEADLGNIRMAAGPRLQGLARAGARDIFLVFSMYDFPYFFAAVPVPPNGDPAGLHKYVQKLAEDFSAREGATHVSGRLIMAGLKRTITRLKTISPAKAPTLEAALRVCADKTAKVVLFPSSDQRRILAEMMPAVLSQSATAQPMTIGQDLQWAALGLDGPPSVSLSLTIQSPSADGAGRMLTVVKGLYALAGQHPETRRLIPDLDQILKRLTPRLQGERLNLQDDSTAADLLIDEVIAPSLLRLDAIARRYACGTNMSGIGKALLIHSNDYNDELPPDLDTLTRTVEMTAGGLVCPATGQSYIYRGAGLTTSAIPSMIMVYEKSDNHAGGRNVLFLDSHVEWITDEERFRELIKKDNEYRRQKGLPV